VDGNFNTNINYPDYVISIAINMQSGSGSAAVVTLEFTYNATDLSFPSEPVKGTDYFLNGGFDSYPTQNITRPSGNAIRISLFTFGTPVSLSTTPTTIIELHLNILNAAGNSYLTWVTTEIVGVFGNPPYTPGNWPNRNDTPLPVELFSFTANEKNEKIELNWKTKTEVNNYGFEIERAIAGENEERLWTKLGFVEGHGNSNSTKSYHFTDSNPWGGSKFVYRLKQIDTDGEYEYSDEVEIELLPTKYELYQNYPNPFNPVTNIKFSFPEDTRASIKIYDILGSLVDELVSKEYKAGFHKVEFNATNYASGIYIYRLETANFTNVKKMMIVK